MVDALELVRKLDRYKPTYPEKARQASIGGCVVSFTVYLLLILYMVYKFRTFESGSWPSITTIDIYPGMEGETVNLPEFICAAPRGCYYRKQVPEAGKHPVCYKIDYEQTVPEEHRRLIYSDNPIDSWSVIWNYDNKGMGMADDKGKFDSIGLMARHGCDEMGRQGSDSDESPDGGGRKEEEPPPHDVSHLEPGAGGGGGGGDVGGGGDGGSLPTCDDGVQNQGEEGLDCGGPCSRGCIDHGGPHGPGPTDLSKGTCNDGAKNQGEMGPDCGGPCPKPCGRRLAPSRRLVNGKQSSVFLYKTKVVDPLQAYQLGTYEKCHTIWLGESLMSMVRTQKEGSEDEVQTWSNTLVSADGTPDSDSNICCMKPTGEVPSPVHAVTGEEVAGVECGEEDTVYQTRLKPFPTYVRVKQLDPYFSVLGVAGGLLASLDGAAALVLLLAHQLWLKKKGQEAPKRGFVTGVLHGAPPDPADPAPQPLDADLLEELEKTKQALEQALDKHKAEVLEEQRKALAAHKLEVRQLLAKASPDDVRVDVGGDQPAAWPED